MDDNIRLAAEHALHKVKPNQAWASKHQSGQNGHVAPTPPELPTSRVKKKKRKKSHQLPAKPAKTKLEKHTLLHQAKDLERESCRPPPRRGHAQATPPKLHTAPRYLQWCRRSSAENSVPHAFMHSDTSSSFTQPYVRRCEPSTEAPTPMPTPLPPPPPEVLKLPLPTPLTEPARPDRFTTPSTGPKDDANPRAVSLFFDGRGLCRAGRWMSAHGGVVVGGGGV